MPIIRASIPLCKGIDLPPLRRILTSFKLHFNEETNVMDIVFYPVSLLDAWPCVLMLLIGVVCSLSHNTSPSRYYK